MNNILTKEFRRNIWLLVAITISLFVLNPLFNFLIISTAKANNDYVDTTIFLWLLMTASFMLPIIVAFFFNYLHSKEKIDLIHSLPVTRSTIFAHRYFIGILYIIIPFLINAFLLFAIDNYNFPELVNFELTFILFLAKWLVFGIFCYSLLVFSNIIAGRLVYGALFTALFVFLMFFNPLVLEVDTYVDLNYSYGFYDLLWYGIDDLPTTAQFIQSILMLVILSAILYYMSLYLYKKRSSEATATAVAIPKLELLMKSLTVYSVLLFAYMILQDTGFAIPFLIIIFVLLIFIIEALAISSIRGVKIKNLLKTGALSFTLFAFSLIFALSGIMQKNEINALVENSDEIYSLQVWCNDNYDDNTQNIDFKTYQSDDIEKLITYYANKKLENLKVSDSFGNTNDNSTPAEYRESYNVSFDIIFSEDSRYNYFSLTKAEYQELYNIIEQMENENISIKNTKAILDNKEHLTQFTAYVPEYKNSFYFSLKKLQSYPYIDTHSINGNSEAGAKLLDALEKDLVLATENYDENFAKLPITTMQLSAYGPKINNLYSNINLDVDYKNTLEVIKEIPETVKNLYPTTTIIYEYKLYSLSPEILKKDVYTAEIGLSADYPARRFSDDFVLSNTEPSLTFDSMDIEKYSKDILIYKNTPTDEEFEMYNTMLLYNSTNQTCQIVKVTDKLYYTALFSDK